MSVGGWVCLGGYVYMLFILYLLYIFAVFLTVVFSSPVDKGVDGAVREFGTAPTTECMIQYPPPFHAHARVCGVCCVCVRFLFFITFLIAVFTFLSCSFSLC